MTYPDRIAQLNDYLAASLNAEGKPAKGFTKRVNAIRAELARLGAQVTQRTPDPTNPVG